jgi:GTP-binding protein
MVDGAIVLVDAAEGPMPQTKFVVGKALKLGLKPDRRHQQGRPPRRAPPKSSTRCSTCSPRSTPPTNSSTSRSLRLGKNGWMRHLARGFREGQGHEAAVRTRLKHVAPPVVEEGPFRMLGTILEANPYLGRIITGRIASGSVKPNQLREGAVARRQAGGNRPHHQDSGVPRPRAHAGRLGRSRRHRRHRGPDQSTVADTICALGRRRRCRRSRSIRRPVDVFIVNDSPLAGTEGDKVTSRMIRDRLLREAEGNVALRVTEAEDKDAMEVAGRGELQLAILIETMRREGFELSCRARASSCTKDEDRQRAGADRGSRHRRRRGILRRRRAEDERAQGRDDRDAPSGGNRLRLVFYAPTARPDRLSGRTADRHARHRDHEPPVPRLRALQGRDPGPPQRRADFQRQGEAVAYACGSSRIAAR